MTFNFGDISVSRFLFFKYCLRKTQWHSLHSVLPVCLPNHIKSGFSHFRCKTHKDDIIIIMFVKGQVRSLFLSPQSGVGPSISSSVVQYSVFLLVCISVPVLAVYFCPSSVRVVAIFSGTVLLPLLCSVLPFFP